MNKLNQYWRVFATGLCFSIFGLGGLVLSFIILPLFAITTPNTIQRELKAQRLIRFTFNAFCLIMKFTGAIDYRIDGIETLQK
ncbi:1-acyl-sn-glycerol-3-phosphate acyltransferase, partial [Vibrio fortis]